MQSYSSTQGSETNHVLITRVYHYITQGGVCTIWSREEKCQSLMEMKKTMIDGRSSGKCLNKWKTWLVNWEAHDFNMHVSIVEYNMTERLEQQASCRQQK